MGSLELNRVTDWLIGSDEPAIRYRARTWLAGRSEVDPEVQRDRAQVPLGPIVSTLLDLPDPAVSPYRKWSGVTSPTDVIDWGRHRPSEVLTLHAVRVLKSAGRW